MEPRQWADAGAWGERGREEAPASNWELEHAQRDPVHLATPERERKKEGREREGGERAEEEKGVWGGGWSQTESSPDSHGSWGRCRRQKCRKRPGSGNGKGFHFSRMHRTRGEAARRASPSEAFDHTGLCQTLRPASQA